MPPRELVIHWFVKTYPALKPNDVPELSLDDLNWLPVIVSAEQEALRLKDKEARSAERHEARVRRFYGR